MRYVSRMCRFEGSNKPLRMGYKIVTISGAKNK